MQDQKEVDAASLAAPNRESTPSFASSPASIAPTTPTSEPVAAAKAIDAAALRAAARRLPLLLAARRPDLSLPPPPPTSSPSGSLLGLRPAPVAGASASPPAPPEEEPTEVSPLPEPRGSTAPQRPPPSPKPAASKIYSWSLRFAALVVGLQGIALLSVFWFRHRIKGDTQAPALMPASAAGSTAQDSPIPSLLAPRAPLPSTHDDGHSLSLLLDPRPTGGRLAPPALTNGERVAALLQEAKRFRNEGDRDLARAALSRAEELDPQNPAVLEQQGELAEEQKNVSRATEYWSRIVSLGPAVAGASYEKARIRLEAEAQAAGIDASEAAFLHRAKTPLQLLGVERRSGSGSPFGQELIFRFRIAASPRSKIALDQISYQFYAYDQIDAGIIVPTNARLTVGFENAFPRWGANGVEVLRVTYRLDHPVPHQRFYGYVFRLFYSGLLQDQRADPPELLVRLPTARRN